jgi:RNA polymerase sigma factor (sigma-70 family)
MQNPLSIQYRDKSDTELIIDALEGSMASLEALLARHRNFIYNIALKMVGDVNGAEDITQEVLIKVITKLSQFRRESSFRTWLYRITFNHFLEMKRYGRELATVSFEEAAKSLDNIPDHPLSAMEELEWKTAIEETKLTCMHGMLLCLDREQRLIFILSEIFNANHTIGAEMLEISKDNYRQKLSRARKDLFRFMQQKCGLVNQSNPCRCATKTKGFIQGGKVDPLRLQFNAGYLRDIESVAEAKIQELENALEENYSALFRKQPFQEKEGKLQFIQKLINHNAIHSLIHFDASKG